MMQVKPCIHKMVPRGVVRHDILWLVMLKFFHYDVSFVCFALFCMALFSGETTHNEKKSLKFIVGDCMPFTWKKFIFTGFRK